MAFVKSAFQINSSFGAKQINVNLIVNKKSRSNKGFGPIICYFMLLIKFYRLSF